MVLPELSFRSSVKPPAGAARTRLLGSFGEKGKGLGDTSRGDCSFFSQNPMLPIQPDQKELVLHECAMHPLLGTDIQPIDFDIRTEAFRHVILGGSHMQMAGFCVRGDLIDCPGMGFVQPVGQHFKLALLPLRETFELVLIIFQTDIDRAVDLFAKVTGFDPGSVLVRSAVNLKAG